MPFFPEMGGEIEVDLGGGIKISPGKVAQGGSAAPDRGVVVIDTEHRRLLGHRG